MIEAILTTERSIWSIAREITLRGGLFEIRFEDARQLGQKDLFHLKYKPFIQSKVESEAILLRKSMKKSVGQRGINMAIKKPRYGAHLGFGYRSIFFRKV
ncbi:hypothetical protein KKC_11231 [Listeria fleischmannii subsp. coloradonensis]|uniref:hypothetical protein n=1 Tax=Listeria fleischmannii TaxID=1069827 RepID=UPI000254F333|nr:hypothetical protein [Listeria fleischmannii]EIA19662.1 hypothetical protein KKC_11231 [Listeria fleischmannii subsp. coloradonensis]